MKLAIALLAVIAVWAAIWRIYNTQPVSAANPQNARLAASAAQVGDMGMRKPLDFYLGSNPFANATPVDQRNSAPMQSAGQQASAPSPDPLVGYVYSGTGTIRGRTIAVIENRQTGSGRLVALGDTLEGGKVTRITSTAVTLRFRDGRRILTKNQDYKLAPLARSAAFLQPPAASTPQTGATAIVPPPNVTVNLQLESPPTPSSQEPAPGAFLLVPQPAVEFDGGFYTPSVPIQPAPPAVSVIFPR